jgi:hypothetical protein
MRPVYIGSFQSFAVFELVKTGLGLGPCLSRPKDRTGPSNTSCCGKDVVGELRRPHPSMKGGASMGPVTWLQGLTRLVANLGCDMAVNNVGTWQ